MIKKFLFLFTLLLLATGGSSLWADVTYELRIGQKDDTTARESTDGLTFTAASWFTVSGSISSKSKYFGKYDGVEYTEGLKMSSSGTISFTTGATSTITIVQCTKLNGSDCTKAIKVKYGDGSPTTYEYNNSDVVTTPTTDENNSNVRVYTLTNQAAGRYVISGESESGVFCVKVTTKLANDITLTSQLGANLKNNKLVIAGAQQPVEVTVGATNNLAGATVTSGSGVSERFTVSYTSGTLTITPKPGATYGGGAITLDIPAQGNYAAATAEMQVEYWTGDISNEYNGDGVGRKWLFNVPWTNNGYFYDHESNCGWTKDGNHFEYNPSLNSGVITTPETPQVSGTYVEQTYGLKVTQTEARKIWMQSANSTHYLGLKKGSSTTGGTIVIPNVATGKTITVKVYAFAASTNMIISQTNGNTQNYTVGTSEGTFSFTTNANYKDVTISTDTDNGTLYFNSIMIEAASTGDATVQSTFPYSWDFSAGSSSWGNTQHQLTNVYSDWTRNADTYYYTSSSNGATDQGYKIDILKGLRFSYASWLSLDWSFGHMFIGDNGGTISIPGLTAGQTVTFVMEGRDASNATTVTTINTSNSGATVPKADGTWTTTEDFVVEADGKAVFTFDKAVSIRSITVSKTAPTITWNETGLAGTTRDILYGVEETHKATATHTDGTPTVSYRSSDSGVATVDANGKVTCVAAGTATITAYVERGEFSYVETSYTVNVQKVDVADFKFVPATGLVNATKWITPKLNFPSIQASAVTSLKVSKVEILDSNNNPTNTYDTDEKISTYFNSGSPAISIENYANLKLSPSLQENTTGGVHKVNVKITGNTVGAKVRITVSFTSQCYNDVETSYTISVTESSSCNFSFMGPTEYTINVGDYMFMPGISGSANGNHDHALASYNNETFKSYVYQIKKGTIDWWKNKDGEKTYKLDEGYPYYEVVGNSRDTSTDKAYIFWVTGQGGSAIDTLMIYGNKPGDATIRATDAQNSTYQEFTVHVVDPKADSETKGVNTLHNDYVNGMTFPYTWDFTKNFSPSLLDGANSLYWEKDKDNNTSYTMGIASSFNYDFADEDDDGSITDDINKIISTGSQLIPQFYGLRIALGNSSNLSWYSKVGKIKLYPNAGDGNPHFKIIGGAHKLTLPAAPTGNRPGTEYKLFIKLKGNGDKARIIFNGGTASSMDVLYLVDGKDKKGNNVFAGTTITFETKDYEHYSSGSDSNWLKDAIFSYTVQPNEDISLQLNNVDIYWIAYSTEANSTVKPNENTHLTGAATSYSYGKALDLAKSEEVNKNNELTAYYAISFTNGDGVASTVTLRQVTLEQNGVPVNTGLVLKSKTPSTNYMIADAENENMYSVPDELETNYLVAGEGDESVVNSTTGSGEGIKTNFILSYTYKKFADDGTTAMTGYQYDRDWSFYKVMPSAKVPVHKAYLQVPGNLRVKTDGTIETITPSGSRRAADGSDDDRPANKLMLDIVYEDEAHGFDATTAINDVKTDTVTVDDDAWYTLQGVRVNAPARGGIYIHNGRKVVIK